MYGKKRITITKENQIVLAGNKSWIPIGRFYITNELIIGRLRNIDSWDTILNENNSKKFEFKSITELRKFAKTEYNL